METYNLYDIGSQVISSQFKRAEPEKVKSVLLALDPLDPKRAFKKLSNLLVCFVVPCTKYVS